MRSFLLLCLLTVVNCKPGAILVPSTVPYAVPFGVAAVLPGPVVTVQEVVPQSPVISTVSEYQAIPLIPPSPGAVVADFLY
uniref:Uncharacterized protein n=1 Tax=Anopheles coluzzii TaxID=1518534 RepID=A0A9I3BD14_ANOCL